MRDYAKIYSSFWTSETTGNLSDTGTILALYLLTSSHNTICGAFRLPDGYVMEDLQWPLERVSEGFAELLGKGFINRCETTKWVFICQHFDWNKPENPNQWKAAKKIAVQIPKNCAWLIDFKEVFLKLCPLECDDIWNPSETLSKGLPKPGTGTGTVIINNKLIKLTELSTGKFSICAPQGGYHLVHSGKIYWITPEAVCAFVERYPQLSDVDDALSELALYAKDHDGQFPYDVAATINAWLSKRIELIEGHANHPSVAN